MKFFAMIEGERKGPFTLDELADAGVTPQTYVWTKGMKDWEKAEENADICRYFRQRIASIQHPDTVVMPGQETASDENRQQETPDDGLTEEQRKRLEEVPQAFREMVRKSGMIPNQPPTDTTDYNRRPQSMLLIAVLATVFCCPIVGFVAIYYSFRTQSLWNQATKVDQVKDSGDLKIKAHDAARKARIWTGITVSLGLMLLGFYIGMAG